MRLQVIGLDDDFFAVEGDISVSGLYIDVTRDIGELGSVQRLRLATMHGSEQITVLARIARIASVNDLSRGNVVTGVAFQFMFEETTEVGSAATTIPIDRSSAIGEFVRCLLRENETGDPRLDHTWEGTLESPTGRAGTVTVNGVSLQGTVLETEFLVPVGDLIRVDIPGPDPNQRIPLYGRAVDSRPFAPHEGRGFRTSVRFEPVAVSPVEPAAKRSVDSVHDAFGALLTAVTAPGPTALPPEPRRQHLSGDLTRVSVISVLTLGELERVTGILHLRGPDSEVRCYLSAGRLVDVERIGDPSLTPQAALLPVLDWPSGSFDLLFEPIVREDRVGKSIQAFLMNLMQAYDEARRGG